MVKQKTANLRICASCEWIFRFSNTHECPKCGFASYGARWVCGNAAYKYEHTQELWMKRKLDKYRGELLDEIIKSKPKRKMKLMEYQTFPA